MAPSKPGRDTLTWRPPLSPILANCESTSTPVGPNITTNPAWPTQKLADELRLEDAVHAQRWATFEELRKAGKDRAAAEVWKEIYGFNQRRNALDLHFAQVMGDWETASEMISSRKDSEAGLPPGTTARLERCLEG